LIDLHSSLVQVRPGIKRLKRYTVEFADGSTENYDAIILATGYKSNVPYWLKVSYNPIVHSLKKIPNNENGTICLFLS